MTISPPTTQFDEWPYKCVRLNETWISHLVGLIDPASKESYWDTGEEYEATQQIERIILALAKGNCNMIGTVHAFAGDTLPDNALWCDGAEFEREDYPALYDILGDVYQIDADTGAVPDLRSRFIVGVNEDEPPEGLSNYDLGQTGGLESVILTGFQAGTHQHGIPNHNHTYDRPRNTGLEAQEFSTGTPVPVPNIDAAQNTGMASLETEEYPPIEASAHENRPPFVALRYFIIAR